MLRRLVCIRLVLAGVFIAAVSLAEAQSDPAFAEIPFNEWVARGDQSRIHWSATIAEPALTWHERIASEVVIRIDGSDLAKRVREGNVIFFIQIADDRGGVWQAHDSIDLSRAGKGLRASDIEYQQPFFVLPGNYQISLAIYQPGGDEHGVIRRKLHVAAMHSDPLGDPFRKLPAIEFIAGEQAPDNYYLPRIRSRLAIEAHPSQPVRIEVLANLTPSERLAGSKKVQDEVRATLLPVMKIFAGADWGGSPTDVEFVDLSRVSVIFRQTSLRRFRWQEARAGLTANQPGIIDVTSLQKHDQAANFFVGEVRSRIRPADERPAVLIVLSRPVVFEPGVELKPIEASPERAQRVFYVRFQPLPDYTVHRGLAGRESRVRASLGPLRDELAPLLRALNPKLFDVTTPEQFRKALATMLSDITAM